MTPKEKAVGLQQRKEGIACSKEKRALPALLLQLMRY
jgi:hypothetical protein